MTANARKFVVFVASLVVLAPALATLLDVGPMGYHDGTALVVRLVGVLLATAALACAIAIGAYGYWVHVIQPAPPVPRTHTRATPAQPRTPSVHPQPAVIRLRAHRT